MSKIIPEQAGSIGILNVGHGDTKLSFDPSNPAECIRAARIVKDMLRRGYALLIEVEQPDGTKTFTRVRDFDETKHEYIIADLDPEIAAAADAAEAHKDQTDESPATPSPRKGRTPRLKSVPASSARGVAVARTAGG